MASIIVKHGMTVYNCIVDILLEMMEWISCKRNFRLNMSPILRYDELQIRLIYALINDKPSPEGKVYIYFRR